MKKFILKDKTGRGYVNPAATEETLRVLLEDDAEDNSGRFLQEYVEEAEVGEEWESRDYKIIRSE